MLTALDFANAVLGASGEGTTHLKLQKLTFYAYGAARAFGEQVPVVRFRNRQHGPVCVEVWERYKYAHAEPVRIDPALPLVPLFGAALKAVRVYGRCQHGSCVRSLTWRPLGEILRWAKKSPMQASSPTFARSSLRHPCMLREILPVRGRSRLTAFRR
jgi:hypothetical protein